MKSLFLLILTLLFFSVSQVEAANSLKPFVTDGCTMFVNGTRNQPDLWLPCCEEHDMRYWFGGSMADRDKTDLRLKACVKDLAGATWAEIIYAGVRAGHSSPIKNKTHWSWGWKQTRANIPLAPDEINYVIEELRALPYDQERIENFIERNFENQNAQN